jgi:hypothetical protein
MICRAIFVVMVAIASFAGAATTATSQTRPRLILGRNSPGQITGMSDDGIVVNLRDGGTQVVQFGEIWRVRKAFASDEPAGTTVIDFANNRLFVAMPLATLAGDLGKKVPLGQFTAPNGDTIYMVTSRITDISNALPGLHNPLSKSVIGTRDGTQQVLETADAAKKIVAAAHISQ